MLPVLVMPMNDPDGILFPHLKTITSQLKHIFGGAFVSVNPQTIQTQAEDIAWLQADSFFRLDCHTTEVPVGRDFWALYAFAADASPDNTLLHLCFVDRLAYILQSQYAGQFIADVQALGPEVTALIFERSALAWETHPRNYRALEGAVTQIGEILFQKSLDFAWCHIVLQAKVLRTILPRVQRPDISMMAEMVLGVRDVVQTRSVDWLAWEDPFIFGREAEQLKAERERSQAEYAKRMRYVAPMLDLLYAAANEGSPT